MGKAKAKSRCNNFGVAIIKMITNRRLLTAALMLACLAQAETNASALKPLHENKSCLSVPYLNQCSFVSRDGATFNAKTQKLVQADIPKPKTPPKLKPTPRKPLLPAPPKPLIPPKPRVTFDEVFDAQSDQDAWHAALLKCWAMPVVASARDLTVDLLVTLDRNGSVLSASIEDIVRYQSDKDFKIASDAALRALYDCSPLPTPASGSVQTQKIIYKFDPHKHTLTLEEERKIRKKPKDLFPNQPFPPVEWAMAREPTEEERRAFEQAAREKEERTYAARKLKSEQIPDMYVGGDGLLCGNGKFSFRFLLISKNREDLGVAGFDDQDLLTYDSFEIINRTLDEYTAMHENGLIFINRKNLTLKFDPLKTSGQSFKVDCVHMTAKGLHSSALEYLEEQLSQNKL